LVVTDFLQGIEDFVYCNTFSHTSFDVWHFSSIYPAAVWKGVFLFGPKEKQFSAYCGCRVIGVNKVSNTSGGHVAEHVCQIRSPPCGTRKTCRSGCKGSKLITPWEYMDCTFVKVVAAYISYLTA
jgi:hypothetical protein